MLRLLLWISGALLAPALFGNPKTIYKNYQSCQTCHISQSGGGLLSPYGKGMAEAFMATWAQDGQTSSLLDEWDKMDLSVNYLHAYVDSRSDGFSYQDDFPMVLEADLAIHLDDRLSYIVSAGYYGDKKTPEFRTHYLNYRYSKNIQFRAGSYFAPFGLSIEDHTSFIRRELSFDQGMETWNLELSYSSKLAQVFFTYSFGEDASIIGSDEGRLRSESPGEEARLIHLVFYPMKYMRLGVSHRQQKARASTSVFMSYSPYKNSYLLAQLSRDKKEQQRHLSYLQFGYYILSGLDLYTQYGHFFNEKDTLFEKVAIGLDWMPTPGLGLKLETSQSLKDGVANTKTFLAALRFWL